ncbi:hypothetical protein Vadar_000985 [Vaccinium darrowii]|uniref:Uncharacterized protein n=1 Tax=Vaccinium darrowii TaxID=229202 RepID=A0ACB7X7C2_9ERIC|nr:hypothetical protein Vadar_000985 [Vaccinium darrowii]
MEKTMFFEQLLNEARGGYLEKGENPNSQKARAVRGNNGGASVIKEDSEEEGKEVQEASERPMGLCQAKLA